MQHNHHHHVDSPLSSESSMIIEGMSRVCPYSPEEKKVRIERYRIKRNQRNFNKKIKVNSCTKYTHGTSKFCYICLILLVFYVFYLMNLFKSVAPI